MKNNVLVLLILLSLSLLFSLAGCKKDDEVLGNVDPIESYDNESVFAPDVDSSQEVTGNLVAKDKRYTFDGNDIIMLNIENQTNVNYSVSVTGTCLDANGNVLYTETQSFDQFASGHKHFFLFRPEMQFDKFTYDFAVEQTDAEMYINHLEYVFGGLVEAKWPVMELVDQGDHSFYPVIIANCGFRSSAPAGLELNAIGNFVIINEREEVIAIKPVGTVVSPGELDYATLEMYYTTEDELVWPEEMKGEVYAVCAITSVEKYEKAR